MCNTILSIVKHAFEQEHAARALGQEGHVASTTQSTRAPWGTWGITICDLHGQHGVTLRIRPPLPEALRAAAAAIALIPASQRIGRGDDTVGNPHRAQIYQIELFELILLLKLYKQLPVEQFEATASQSTVPSTLLEKHRAASSTRCAHAVSRCMRRALLGSEYRPGKSSAPRSFIGRPGGNQFGEDVEACMDAVVPSRFRFKIELLQAPKVEVTSSFATDFKTGDAAVCMLAGTSKLVKSYQSSSVITQGVSRKVFRLF